MNKKMKIFLYILLASVILTVGYGTYYVNDYYHAEECISEYLNGNENVSVVKTENALFLNGSGDENAIIFYPGAKVEYTAYLPLLINLSNEGVDCFIVEMPFNLALLDTNRANDIIDDEHYNYTNWFIGGHSLGGVAASSYAHENKDKLSGLILFASYPTEPLTDMSVLSIYGSEDKVLNIKEYEKARKYFPSNYTECVIDGANHANYAFYGKQDGDGIAGISRDEQIKISVNEIITFIT